MTQEKEPRLGTTQNPSALQHVNLAIMRHWQRKLARERVRPEPLTTAKAGAK